MKYFVCILFSRSRNKYYIGQCQNLDDRLEDHRNSRSGFTRGTKDWVLKWSVECDDRSEAMSLEQLVKRKKSRRYLEFLIDGGQIG